MKPIVGGIAAILAVVVALYLFGVFADSYEEATAPAPQTEAESYEACLDKIAQERGRLREVIDEVRQQIDDVESGAAKKSSGEELTDEHKDFLVQGQKRQLARLEQQYDELGAQNCEAAPER